MYICPLCDSPYVLNTGESWNGKCFTCGKFIGNEIFRFLYFESNKTITNIHGVYIPNETYNSLEISQKNKTDNEDPIIYISYEKDSVLYYSDDFNSIKYFYSGWLYCRSYLTVKCDYRDRFINYEGLIQDN